jgi:hypothetical protein
VSDIREREEGLFSRHGATRALCVVALICWVPMTLYAPYLIAWLLAPEGIVPNIGVGFLLVSALVGLLVSSIAILTLWLWRKCDHCHRRLFSDASQHFLAKQIRDLGDKRMLDKRVVNVLVQPDRAPNAAEFLGSYRGGAIVSMGLKGDLRCQWCGREDGQRPASALTNPR